MKALAIEFKIKNPSDDNPKGGRVFNGGPEGIRTLDLCDANAALSQLSHEPTKYQYKVKPLNYYNMFFLNCQAQIQAKNPSVCLRIQPPYQRSLSPIANKPAANSFLAFYL
jgi:hypothetical protein